jgi:hypothetical protein
MLEARDLLDQQFLTMRALCLRLAADFDRIQHSPGGEALLQSDPRVALLRQAAQIASDAQPQRAVRLEELLSDR